MRQGGVGARGGNGREGNVAQFAAFAPKGLQRLRRRDLGQAAARRGLVEPAQETRHRHAVAQMGGAGAGELRGVLARLHQADGIGSGLGFAAGFREEAGQAARRGAGVEQDFLFFRPQILQRVGQSGGRRQQRQSFERGFAPGGQLFGLEEQARLALARNERIAERDRRMGDVGAAQVEGPGQSVRVADQQRVGLEGSGDARQLFHGAFAGMARRDAARRGPTAVAGRSLQMASIGFSSTATRLAPAFFAAASNRATCPAV